MIRRFFSVSVAVFGLLVLAAGSVSAGIINDGNFGDLTAIHGIPELPYPVDVYLNDSYAFSFDYGDSFGPVKLEAGRYTIDVRLAGTTVLSKALSVQDGQKYTVVAHLTNNSGIMFSTFKNNSAPAARGNALVTVRHLAQAPTVDLRVAQADACRADFIVRGLSNPNELSPLELNSGAYQLGLMVGGSEVFTVEKIEFSADKSYYVYALGFFPDNFQFFVQTVSN